MYRLGVVSNTFKKASDATLDRSKGQLMRVNTSGQATHVLGEGNLIHLPLIEDFVAAEHNAASLQVEGIAKVYVEAEAGITAGSKVAVGATGVGIKLAVTGNIIIGVALENPSANGVFIPVLLSSAFEVAP